MTNLEEIKQQLGKSTEELENQAKEYQEKYYSNLEPWQRGLLLLGLLGLTTLTIYWLLSENKDKANKRKEELETQAEERLIRRMGILKKLRD